MDHSQNDFVSSIFNMEFYSSNIADYSEIEIPASVVNQECNIADYSEIGIPASVVNHEFAAQTPIGSNNFDMQIPINTKFHDFNLEDLLNDNRHAESFTKHAICSVCGDISSGKHYGAESCHGCKGFFRRTVRNNEIFKCRYKKKCDVNRNTRNNCRYCRFRKCLEGGMKREEVQEKRDKLGSKKKNNPDDVYRIFFQNADQIFIQGNTNQVNDQPNHGFANLNNVQISIKSQLLKLNEWSKNISRYFDVSPPDWDALFRARAKDLLLLELVRRSLNQQNMLLLADNSTIFRPNNDLNAQWNADLAFDANVITVIERILDELVRPFNELAIDVNEFAAIKVIAFFDPYAKGLGSSNHVKVIRRKISTYLENYVKDNQQEPRGRFGNLILVLSSLQSIANLMIGQIHLAKILQVLELDKLIEDILL